MKLKQVLFHCFMILSVGLLSSCTIIDSILNKAVTDPVATADHALKDAIQELSRNSSDWQNTLRDLEDKLKKDSEGLMANEVTQLMSRGIAQTGTELRCNTDFVGNRMKQGLERLLAQLQHKEVIPSAPAFCNVVPEVLDMGHRPTHISFYGYDLDSPSGIQVSLHDNSGETDLGNWTARPTHYLLTLDVSQSSSIPLCNRENRKIVLKSKDKTLGDVNVIKFQCPPALTAIDPSPPKEAFPSYEESFAGGAGGFRVDRIYGARCDAGYKRDHVNVETLEFSRNPWGMGSARCEFKAWANPGDERDCTAIIHFGGDPLTGIRCRTTIIENGVQLPQPSAPPCPCW